MISSVTRLYLLALLPLILAQNATVNLWPLPRSYTNGTTPICIADDFNITITTADAPQDLWDAVGRAASRLWSSKHEYLSTTFGAEFFSDPSSPCEHWLHSLELTLDGNNTDSVFQCVTQDPNTRMQMEAYNLTVPVDGTAVIKANSALGLFRGLTTFEDMWYYLAPQGSGGNNLRKRWSNGEALYAPFGPYEVSDSPAFGWRAVLLDTSRNFYPIADIQSMLDTMAMVKLSTWHWHITDSQSWPLDLPNHMELAQKGAYSPARHYTQDDVKNLVQYAGERGIDVVMEIDSPGHTASVGLSHPEYVACFYADHWINWANEPPPGQLLFSDPEVSMYMKGVFEDAIGLISSKYFGTGGDEINMPCMTADPRFNASLVQYNWTFVDALNNFTAITHSALHEAGKTPVVWEEMVDTFGNITAIVPETVVLVWIDSSHAREVADLGYSFVHASSDYFYLDCGQGEWIGENGGANSWCDPFKSWEHIYSFNPYDNLTDAQQSQVLGGQVSLWSEQTSHANLEVVMWPRAAALAELFWTGPGPNGSYPRVSNDAFPRMHDIRYRMVDRGIRAEPIAPEWCALRPGQCNLYS